jgi:hypothetical protein
MKMRSLYIIIIISIFIIYSPDLRSQDISETVKNCIKSSGPDAVYLKDFNVNLESAKPNEKPPVFRTTLALRKGVIYRFSVCNNPGSQGEAVLRLYDDATLLLSTFNPSTGKQYNAVNFDCKKSGAYTILISTRDGKAGDAIGVLSYVKKN